MKCPRCSSTVPPNPDPNGFLMCPGCGAKLRSKTTSTMTPGAPAPTPRPGPPAGLSPDSTLPPGMMATVPRPGSTPLAPAPAPRPAAPPPAAPPPAPAPRPAPAPAPATAPPAVTLDALMTEIRAVRRVQDEILGLLRSERRTAGAPVDLGMGGGDADRSLPPAPAPVRARRRKSVLLIDDDDASCDAATRALQQAEVPVRVAREGNAGLAAIAEEKPDVIAMELDIAGEMTGKDVINMIKATMEWVDIPIVLYTRATIESQKEARTVHGADEFVIKGPTGAADLVSRVIAIFRRG